MEQQHRKRASTTRNTLSEVLNNNDNNIDKNKFIKNNYDNNIAKDIECNDHFDNNSE